MAKKNSTMSPKRLFVLLCLAGLLMWLFSNSEVEIEVSTDLDKNKVEQVTETELEKDTEAQQDDKKEKSKKSKRKSSKMTKDVKNNSYSDDNYLKKRNLDYDPASRN